MMKSKNKSNIKPELLEISEVYFEYFRNALAQYLEEHKEDLPKKEFAAKVGLSEASISCYLNKKSKNRRYPEFQTQIAIASAAGYEYIDFLLTGRKESPLKKKEEKFMLDLAGRCPDLQVEGKRLIRVNGIAENVENDLQ